jgi:hypothetical protein
MSSLVELTVTPPTGSAMAARALSNTSAAAIETSQRPVIESAADVPLRVFAVLRRGRHVRDRPARSIAREASAPV